MWDRKPDPIPASVPDFPHDLGQIPGAPDFQATSAPVRTQTYLSRAWCGRQDAEQARKPKSGQHLSSSPF